MHAGTGAQLKLVGRFELVARSTTVVILFIISIYGEWRRDLIPVKSN
jgi:hypothetical protein